jgi:hypothetical protein
MSKSNHLLQDMRSYTPKTYHCDLRCTELLTEFPEDDHKCHSILSVGKTYKFVNDRCGGVTKNCFDSLMMLGRLDPIIPATIRALIEVYEAQHPGVVRWEGSLKNRQRHFSRVAI